jgi:hypothetical protein
MMGEQAVEAATHKLFPGQNITGAPVTPSFSGAVGRAALGAGRQAVIGNTSNNAQPQSTGGRAERKAGGSVKFDHAARAASLVRAAAIAKGQHNKATEPLLNLPDEHITKALAIANRSI